MAILCSFSAEEDQSLESALARNIAIVAEAGRATWPHLVVERAALVKHLTAKPDWAPECAADLYLAIACSEGATGAVLALDPLLRAVTVSVASRVDRSPSYADEVAQNLYESLLLSSPPRIGEYQGRAALRTWLTVCALRLSHSMRRRIADAPGMHQQLISSDMVTPTTVERDYVKAAYGDHLLAAIRHALVTLSERERELLRHSVIHGAGVEELATLYGIGKSTASRWLTAARNRLADETRSQFCERLRLTREEFASFAEVFRSEFDGRMASLLGEG